MTISRRAADAIPEFRYHRVAFERDDGRRGLAVYTDQHRRERHYEMLCRVLRHNLRNGLTRVLATIEALLVEGDSEFVREHAGRGRDETRGVKATRRHPRRSM